MARAGFAKLSLLEVASSRALFGGTLLMLAVIIGTASLRPPAVGAEVRLVAHLTLVWIDNMKAARWPEALRAGLAAHLEEAP